MRIQHNIMAMNAYRNYTNNVSAMKKNLERLSSGYRINRAGDDAAGLAISEKMRAQITGLETAQKNAKDGISLVQTAEGALTEVHDMLNRMVELATQSANGTYDNTTDRYQLQKEMDQLRDEINRIADSANFNGIKLLDGKSLAGDLSVLGVNYDSTSIVDGLTIGDIRNGGGTNAQYTIDISKMFSEGDVITITVNDGKGNLTGVAFTYTNTAASLNNGNYFNGNTAEEQAKNLASKLGVNGTIGSNFDVTVDGTKIILTARTEGTDEVPSIAGVKSTNNNVSLADMSSATTVGDIGGTLYVGGFELMGGINNKAGALQIGDKLTFNFTYNGVTLSVEIEVNNKMINPDAKESMEELVNALKKAHFKDIDSTLGIDESQLKVEDLFDITANTSISATDGSDVPQYGAIKIEAKAGNYYVSAGKVELNRAGQKYEWDPITESGKTFGPKSGITYDTWDLKIDASSKRNFTYGDKVKFEGALADGRTFEVELTAGLDFEIVSTGTSQANMIATMGKLQEALEKGDIAVTIKDADGNVTGTMTTKELFGSDSNGNKGEFTVTVDNAGTIRIKSNRAGTAANHQASQITKITINALDDVSTDFDWTVADPQTAAQSTIKVGDGLKYGSAIKVGDKVYEIVADARDTSSRNNEAVVVSDPTDAKAVAKALAEAIKKNESNYNVTYSNDGTVTIESKGIGSDQKALAVTFPYGDSVTTASFKFDPSKVKEGSVLTFNGQKYEFVKTGNTPANSDAIAIQVDDFAKADAKILAEAFKNVLNNGTAEIADDGTITLHGLEVEGKIESAGVQFENNLVLQIGDTADSWNQLKVNLSDMHTDAMGISGISIADQESAATAIDAIRGAINYVSDVRGTLGATQNRLDHTINNLSVMTENIQDAESTIRDVDIAEEMMAYTKNNILIQSAQAMLAQANQVPQGVLQLLQ